MSETSTSTRLWSEVIAEAESNEDIIINQKEKAKQNNGYYPFSNSKELVEEEGLYVP